MRFFHSLLYAFGLRKNHLVLFVILVVDFCFLWLIYLFVLDRGACTKRCCVPAGTVPSSTCGRRSSWSWGTRRRSSRDLASPLGDQSWESSSPIFIVIDLTLLLFLQIQKTYRIISPPWCHAHCRWLPCDLFKFSCQCPVFSWQWPFPLPTHSVILPVPLATIHSRIVVLDVWSLDPPRIKKNSYPESQIFILLYVLF